jgi:demethoxyubiquinone hydroxylase (CLK1/Coq7/Cat5 family)
VADDPPRAPGLWAPAWAVGAVLAVAGAGVGFVVTVSVNERRLDNIEDHLARLDRLDDASAADRRDFAVRLGRLEDGPTFGRGHP